LIILEVEYSLPNKLKISDFPITHVLHDGNSLELSMEGSSIHDVQKT
jgi:hypothetical protein